MNAMFYLVIKLFFFIQIVWKLTTGGILHLIQKTILFMGNQTVKLCHIHQQIYVGLAII